MKKDVSKSLKILCDTRLSLAARLKKLNISRGEVMEMLDDPSIQQEYISNCRNSILLLELPEVMKALLTRCLDSSDATRAGFIKLYLQAIDALKPEEHKHVHLYENMSDEAIRVRLERTREFLEGEVAEVESLPSANTEEPETKIVDVELVETEDPLD